LPEEVASGVRVLLHLGMVGEGKAREGGGKSRSRFGVVGVEERGNAGEAEDARSGVEEVEVRKMTVCSLCRCCASVRAQQ
jgi:hypothetical protein